jgi:hypothetical protein
VALLLGCDEDVEIACESLSSDVIRVVTPGPAGRGYYKTKPKPGQTDLTPSEKTLALRAREAVKGYPSSQFEFNLDDLIKALFKVGCSGRKGSTGSKSECLRALSSTSSAACVYAVWRVCVYSSTSL